MIDYHRVLEDLFETYESKLEAALYGNIEPYCYKEETTENECVHDANYINRLKLAYTILYTKKNAADSRIGGLLLKLYHEELLDREINDFQGIGSALNVLTYLLNKYDLPERKEFFQRAKRANFDCSLGFSDSADFVNSTLESYDFDSAIRLLIELGEKERASELLAEALNRQDIVDKSRLCFYEECYHNLGNIDGEIDISRKIMNMSVLSDDDLEVCSAMLNLIKVINKKKDYSEAGKVFDMLIPRLHSIENWYCVGLGRQSLEQCMDVILNCDELSERLWEWAETYLKMIAENMHGNLYKKAALAASKMGDLEFSEMLSDKYDELITCINKTTPSAK